VFHPHRRTLLLSTHVFPASFVFAHTPVVLTNSSFGSRKKDKPLPRCGFGFSKDFFVIVHGCFYTQTYQLPWHPRPHMKSPTPFVPQEKCDLNIFQWTHYLLFSITPFLTLLLFLLFSNNNHDQLMTLFSILGFVWLLVPIEEKMYIFMSLEKLYPPFSGRFPSPYPPSFPDG